MPFAGFPTFEACLMSMGGDTPENRAKCGSLQAQFEGKLLIRPLLTEKDWREAFEWVPNIERIKAYNKTNPNTKIYAIEALHEMVTDPQNVGHGPRKYTNEELIKSARTLIGGFFNWNHKEDLKQGPNDIIDAEFSEKSNVIEAIGAITDKEAQEAIASGKVKHVSIQAPAPREIEVTNDGIQIPKGLIFEGLALITEGEVPGDPKSSIRLIETLGVRDSSLNGENHKTTSMPTDNDFRAVTLPSIIKALDESNLPPELKLGFGAMARHTFSEAEHPGECPPGQHMGPGGTCVINEQECPEGQHKGPDGTCVINEQECPIGQERGPDGECHPIEGTAEKIRRINRAVKNVKEGLTDDLLKKLSLEFKDKGIAGLDPALLAKLSSYPQVATQVGAMEKTLGELKEALKPENIARALETQREKEPRTLEMIGKGGRKITMPGRHRSY
ncbi:MAG: hypothetical protein V3T99_05915 [Nitrososphaerales archaeon]